MQYSPEHTKKIRKREETLIGKVIAYVEDKDRVYQIVSVNHSRCSTLPNDHSLFDEYDDSYLERVKVSLRKWLGRQVSLTDLEHKVNVTKSF